jgi:hypothetical protein
MMIGGWGLRVVISISVRCGWVVDEPTIARARPDGIGNDP